MKDQGFSFISLSSLTKNIIGLRTRPRSVVPVFGLFALILLSVLALNAAGKGPTVTINQAVGQLDPTSTSPVNFTAVFSAPVTGFTGTDVTISGTAGGIKTVVVTDSGDHRTYAVAVSGMTSSGTVLASIASGRALDAAGNGNRASTSSDRTITFDVTAPTVTINQAIGQPDPSNASIINFRAVFSEPVTGFGTGDITIGGTAGATTATVTGSGTTYNVALSGMITNGTVTATINAGVAQDLVGHPNSASTSSDNSVTYSVTTPTVTINQALTQVDPTRSSPINFTVVFSVPVSGFTNTDVALSGTAGGNKRITVTGSGTTYNVAVTRMSGGTVIASIAANVAQDAAGNRNAASTSTDNSVTYDTSAPTVTINRAVGQADPTNISTINYTAVFSEPVTGFTNTDVSISGTAGGIKSAVVTDSGDHRTYAVVVSGMTSSGTVVAIINSGVAQDAAGNNNSASTSTDNSVAYDVTGPTVTINQAASQADPTNASTINFTAVFSEPVTGFGNGDITIGGTAGATTATVTGSGTTYNVAVSGMSGSGTVNATIGAGVAQDAVGNGSGASTSTDNSVVYDVTAPTVTINQAATQTDPTNGSPINFTVEFSEAVSNFANGDVTLSGTAGATTGTVTGSGTTYNVAVAGMSGTGTVIATIGAGVAQDAAGNGNGASTSTDNSVAYDATAPTVTINQAATQTDPTNGSTINFTVEFSEPVSDFATGDVTLSGTAGATTGTVTGSGTTYNVAVAGMGGSGTVIATIGAGVAQDAIGNGNGASTSTDNSVAYDATAPTVTINQAATQTDPTNGSTINFRVEFSEAVSDFATGDVTLSGTAGATTGTVTGSGTTYNVAVSGMSGSGTVIATIGAGVAQDAIGNGNSASTSTDNSVTYDGTAPTVTINQAATQTDPTNGSEINFTVEFSEAVSDFATGDVTLSGTAGATTGTVTGSGTTYNVAVSGMSGSGTVIATIDAGVAQDTIGNSNSASTSTDNSVAYDATAPTVTINQAATQTDPTNGSPINFTVEFSKSVSDFATGDVTLSGTAGATTATVTGSGTTYNVAVDGMSGSGTVIATIDTGVAQDAVGNGNSASTSTDNSVTYDATTPTPVRFAAVGDFGCACPGELDVSNLVKSWSPEFIITMGDNNYPLGEASTIDAAIGQYYHDFIYPYVGTYGAGADENRFFPSAGNHDWGDGFIQPPTLQPYTDYFTLPGNERYYEFVRGPVHFFVIASDEYEPDGNTPTSVQGQWLQNRLAAATEPWKIVYFHHPPYSSGSHGSSAWMQWPFQTWGATAVLSGHDHLYERITQNNLVYFVNGLGGAGRDAVVRTPPNGSQVRYFADHGAMLVEADTESLNFQFITRNGTLIDTYTIYSNPAAHTANAPANLTAAANCSSQITLSWADNASNEDGHRIQQSTDGTNFADIATLQANVNTYSVTNLSTSTTYYYRVLAFNGLGDTTPSNSANATTPAVSSTEPSNLTTTTTSNSRITLNWTDNICSELGFKVERSSDGVDFTQIATVAPNVTKYLDTGLLTSTTYYYRARAYTDAGDSNYSNVAVGVTGPPPPPPPSGLSATAVSATQIDLSWTDNSNDEDSFRIYRSSDGISFFWYLTAGANATTFSDTGRTASTTYYYRVTAHNSGGESPKSNTASATTFPPPAAPSNLTATAISSSRIDLSWTDNSNDEDGFKIYRSTDNVNFTFYATMAANVTTRSNTSLSSSTTYYYRVLAYNLGGTSAYSNVASATTFAIPAAPTNLSATAVSSSRIDLSWTDNATDESGFKIYRSTDGVTFIWYYTPGANATSFSDTGRTASTTYHYRLLAYNANGNSGFSNTVSATTFGPPSAPSNLTATAISSSRIDLAWIDNSTDEDGFKIYRSTDNVNFAFYATVGANVTTRSNTSLSGSTTYYYRVFAYNSGGNSANSNVASATTLP